ncbi:hypothetical protein [Rhizobium sp. GN54]|uniref:hypothetical protein n=1 Tax=Rhizobium sp. GN54 TaxID=2898150 RepID=UPI001E519618|nr:hypothetical protein [Rhizobium sp. GN54]MCD2185350.1 hypothetical protein [Rhizobium sp. GN54]
MTKLLPESQKIETHRFNLPVLGASGAMTWKSAVHDATIANPANSEAALNSIASRESAARESGSA